MMIWTRESSNPKKVRKAKKIGKRKRGKFRDVIWDEGNG